MANLEMVDLAFRDYLTRIRRFEIFEIKGDGNCLYRALASGIIGSEARFQDLKRNVVYHMRKNPELYEERFENRKEFFKHVEGLALPNEWGDENCIAAASRYYEVNVNVFSPPRLELKFPNEENFATTVFISYHNNSHYNFLKPFEEEVDLDPLITPVAEVSENSENSSEADVQGDIEESDWMSDFSISDKNVSENEENPSYTGASDEENSSTGFTLICDVPLESLANVLLQMISSSKCTEKSGTNLQFVNDHENQDMIRSVCSEVDHANNHMVDVGDSEEREDDDMVHGDKTEDDGVHGDQTEDDDEVNGDQRGDDGVHGDRTGYDGVNGVQTEDSDGGGDVGLHQTQ